MVNGINTTKNELYTAAELEEFSKIEVIDKYVLLAIKYEEMAENYEQVQDFLRLANHNTYGTSSEKREDPDQLNFSKKSPKDSSTKRRPLPKKQRKK